MIHKNNLEQFEQEYADEIGKLNALRFSAVETPQFRIPGYSFFYTKALSVAFAVPALAFVFGFFFYNSSTQNPYNQDLAKIEQSNARIMNQINTLDYENTNS